MGNRIETMKIRYSREEFHIENENRGSFKNNVFTDSSQCTNRLSSNGFIRTCWTMSKC